MSATSSDYRRIGTISDMHNTAAVNVRYFHTPHAASISPANNDCISFCRSDLMTAEYGRRHNRRLRGCIVERCKYIIDFI